jgi:hypothetical protein
VSGTLALVVAVSVMAVSCSTGPGTDQSRPVVQPVAGQPVAGVKWEWDHVDLYRPYLETFGPGVTFFELVWCGVEPEPGQRDWSGVDEVVADAGRLGFRMALKIRVGSCWATGQRLSQRGRLAKTASLLPSDLDAYSAFVAEVVRRYQPRGVDRYAIENEVNAPVFWESSAADYERLVRAAAAVIHSTDPKALVLDGGISSTGSGAGLAAGLLDQGKGDEAVAAYRRYYARRLEAGRSQMPEVGSRRELQAALDGPGRRSLEFLDATFRLARDHVVDAYQLHFYERWDNVPALLTWLRSRLPAAMPIQAWEVGLFWPGGPDDETELSAETAKVTSLLMAGGVRPVIWLPAIADVAGKGSELRWGLFDIAGRPRPAAGIFHQLAAEATSSTTSALPEGALQGIALARDGRTSMTIWSEKGTRLAGSPPGAQARSLAGDPVAWGPDGLRIDGTPVVVDMSGPIETALGLIR